MSSSFGKIFRLTSFGESHGDSIGGIIDGCPAGLKVDFQNIQNQLDRRKPGQSKITTQRSESDAVVFHSGIFEGTTLGSPISFSVKNKDHRSKDYSKLKDVYRPSHADYTYDQKYGARDYRGGGRSSARETVARVVAGAIASQILKEQGIQIASYVSRIGEISLSNSYSLKNIADIDQTLTRCPDVPTSSLMEKEILSAQADGDSLGGVISGVITGLPAGVGEPVFDKLNAKLAQGLMSINAVKGFEIGSGFEGTLQRASQQNDAFEMKNGRVVTSSNNSGGIQGGISNGQEVTFKLAFKPTATISKSQLTVDNSGNEVDMSAQGRHDPCVVPRAVPIVDGMTALVVLDLYLRSRLNRMDQL